MEQMHHREDMHQADLITPVIVERATANMRVSPPKNNFDVLIRILEEPDILGPGKIKGFCQNQWQIFLVILKF